MQEKILQNAYDANYNQVIEPNINQGIPQISLESSLMVTQDRSSAVHQPVPRYGAPYLFEQSQEQRQQTNQNLAYTHMSQSRPKSPSNVTSLTPSRVSAPVMSAYQTPPQRHLAVQRLIHKNSPSDGESDKSCEEDEIDVVNDVKQVDSSGVTDSSVSMMSTNSSSSLESPTTGGSNSSSPASNSTNSPRDNVVKKKVRTNYSPQQVQALEKVFHENPYPEPETMEKLAGDLDIPEAKLKVWFQNKRARWRRRAAENPHPAYMAQMSPMMSPMGSYGVVPHHHPMLHGSPTQVVPGSFYYPPPSFGTPGHPATNPLGTPGHLAPHNFGTPGRVVPSTPVTNSSPSSTTSSSSSPANTSDHQNQQSPHTQMTPPYQHRLHPHFSPYMPFSYSYGMCPPYYC